MLSYRHAFHAGNFADVLKHWIQVEVLDYLKRKDKPFVYIDTHSGAGMYRLDSDEAQKNGEYQTGIGRLSASEWPELAQYLDVVEAAQALAQNGEAVYPGSPWFTTHALREKDKSYLFELHPRDFGLLEQLTYRDRRVQVRHEDGFKGLISLLPTHIKRGLILMDPPYEVKTDYQATVETLVAAHRRMATATYALWYPVVERSRIDELERAFQQSGIRNIQLFELGIKADTEGRGMTASGMILINPPYVLMEKAKVLLPRLSKFLSEDSQPHFRCDVLVPE
ncbi:MAG: 23S rRNA (adenine(2030)-N(6))-methyltransferase RlmJ [Oceanobacter sp.]